MCWRRFGSLMAAWSQVILCRENSFSGELRAQSQDDPVLIVSGKNKNSMNVGEKLLAALIAAYVLWGCCLAAQFDNPFKVRDQVPV